MYVNIIIGFRVWAVTITLFITKSILKNNRGAICLVYNMNKSYGLSGNIFKASLCNKGQ